MASLGKRIPHSSYSSTSTNTDDDDDSDDKQNHGGGRSYGFSDPPRMGPGKQRPHTLSSTSGDEESDGVPSPPFKARTDFSFDANRSMVS